MGQEPCSVALAALAALCVTVAGCGAAPAPLGEAHEAPAKEVLDPFAMCNQGNAFACTKAGRLYMDGEGVPKDPARALAAYERACELGEFLGCASAALWLLGDGKVVRRDPMRGLAYAELVCTRAPAELPAEVRSIFGDLCRRAGQFHYTDDFGAKDLLKAANYLRRACDLGNAQGCFATGYMLDRGIGVAVDGLAAATALNKACNANHGIACALLAGMYVTGRGVSVDYERGRTLAQRGCKLGDHTACTTYGSALATGTGGHQDTAEAAQVLKAPCSAGIAEACAVLGPLYRDGDGVPRNKKRAVELLRIGCERGGVSCGVFGATLCPRPGDPDADCRQAIDPLSRACEQKEGDTCVVAGILLGLGLARVLRAQFLRFWMAV